MKRLSIKKSLYSVDIKYHHIHHVHWTLKTEGFITETKRNVLCEFQRDRRRISFCSCLPCIFNNREKYIKHYYYKKKTSFFKFTVVKTTSIWFFGFRVLGKKKNIYILPKRADDLLILKLKSRTEIGHFLGGIKKFKKKKAASNYILFLKSHFFLWNTWKKQQKSSWLYSPLY